MQSSQIKVADPLSLEKILNDDNNDLEHPGLNGAPAGGWDEEVADTTAAHGFCIECEGAFLSSSLYASTAHLCIDQPAQVLCNDCTDLYCEVCFAAQHRKGTRKAHVFKPHGPKKAPTKIPADKIENGESVCTIVC